MKVWVVLQIQHTSAGRVAIGANRVECVLFLATVGHWSRRSTASMSFGGHWHTRWTSRDSPQALTLLGGARFTAWHLRHPFLRNTDRVRSILGESGLWCCAQSHLKKRPCAALVRLVGRTANTNMKVSGYTYLPTPRLGQDMTQGHF